MRLIDSHGHLQAEAFADDADEVIAAAQVAGVERILAPGWDPASSEASIALARRHDDLDASVGVHPHAPPRSMTTRWAVDGRTGRRTPPWSPSARPASTTTAPSRRAPAQLANLRRNLRLALETGKPAILHCRSRPASATRRTS